MVRLAIVVLALLAVSFSQPTVYPILPGDNIALQWATVHANLLIKNGLIPPAAAQGAARSLKVLWDSIYDAWTPYDRRAVPTQPNGIPRMRHNTPQSSIEKSISFAAYRAMSSLFDRFPVILSDLDNFFLSLGYNKTDVNQDTNNPAGVGNRAAAYVLTAARRDGHNQFGDEPGSAVPGTPYGDYTNYYPVNAPQPAPRTTVCSQLRSVNHWQPLTLPGPVTQTAVTIFTCSSKTFALSSPLAVKIPGPPTNNTNRGAEFRAVFSEVLDINGQLDDAKKLITEFWALTDGATAWQRIAISAARNGRLSLEDSIKLFFAQSNAGYDSGVAAWCNKRIFDGARPATVIPCLFEGQIINGWQAPYEGVGSIPASSFRTYLTTPAFSEYPSGHSAYSGASSIIMKNFFGNDNFIANDTLIAEGTSRTEPKRVLGQTGYIAGKTDVPNSGPASVGYVPANDFVIHFNTWTEAAESAGVSRLYGGFHVSTGNVDGLYLGRETGKIVWDKCVCLWNPKDCKHDD